MNSIIYKTYKSKIEELKAYYGMLINGINQENDAYHFDQYAMCDQLLRDIDAMIDLRKYIARELKPTDECIKFEHSEIHMPLDQRGHEEFMITDGYLLRHFADNGYTAQYSEIKKQFLEDYDDITLVDNEGNEIDMLPFIM